jgi:hypothetical protein
MVGRPAGCGMNEHRRIASVLRRIRVRAVASEQSFQLEDVPRLVKVCIETFGEARVAEVRTRVATEGDQPELRGRKPLAQTTTQFYSVHPRR